jgi:membrane peptidoglycan carboxypeptidase
VNDHRSHRRGSPAWPTGDDPDSGANGAQSQERTGFWSPLWDEDEPPQAGGPHVGGRPNGAHHARSGSNGSNGHSSNGHGANGANGAANGSNGRATHRLPDREAPGAHHAAPPPRPARPASGPAWPSEEPPPPAQPPAAAPQRPAPARPNGRPPAGQTTRAIPPRPAGPPRPGRPGGPTGPGGPGIPDGPTEHLPPVHGYRGSPEPELLTHRELDYDESPAPYEEPDLGPQRMVEDDDADVPLTDEQRRRRRKKIWRRVRRVGYVATALMIIGPMVGFFIAYQMVDVPSPESVKQSQGQTVSIEFSDKTEIGKVVPQGGENRTLVKYPDIPKDVLHAVFAAEDADFMSNPGFDITGVLRAGWNQVTGGEGGGSTITQQYVKKATGKEEKTVTRKALEVVTAYKMNNTYTKEDIITAYLNTIYFGRGAYGISAAAKSYYGKELKDVTAPEAALLAGMIQNPSRYKEQDYMEKRWNYVMDQLVSHNWYPADKRKADKFPEMIGLEKARPQAITGARAHIKNAVITELEQRAHISEDELYQRGYRIRTTINPRAQRIAEQSVNDVLTGQPKNIRPALVAVNPKNGAVLAYYGGSNGVGLDWAAQPQEPGSSFKPFDLVALLEDGKGLAERYDGTSGRMFPGRAAPVRNSSGASCGKECTVAEAMERSINTVFYDVAVNTVGTNKVLAAARQAGITSDLNGKADDKTAPDGNIAIGGGDTRVSTMEMASAYATFAADGMFRTPHLVSQVLYPDGKIRWQAPEDERQAFDADSDKNHQIARNVTESLKPVIPYSHLDCGGDRPCAGKTGTHQLGTTEDNAKAWMVGYTPTLSAAVSMGAETPKGKQMPLRNSDGNIVYGSGLPGKIWQEFVDRYLEGTDAEDFGDFEPIGDDYRDQSTGDEDANQGNNQGDDNGNRDGDHGNGNGNGNGNGGPGNGGQPTDPTDPGNGGQPTQPSPTEPTDPGGGTGEPTGGPVFPPIGD